MNDKRNVFKLVQSNENPRIYSYREAISKLKAQRDASIQAQKELEERCDKEFDELVISNKNLQDTINDLKHKLEVVCDAYERIKSEKKSVERQLERSNRSIDQLAKGIDELQIHNEALQLENSRLKK